MKPTLNALPTARKAEDEMASLWIFFCWFFWQLRFKQFSLLDLDPFSPFLLLLLPLQSLLLLSPFSLLSSLLLALLDLPHLLLQLRLLKLPTLLLTQQGRL